MASLASAKAGSHIAHADTGLNLGWLAPGTNSTQVRNETLAELIDARPTTVYETGFRWQVIPAKLFRYQDRLSYLKGTYPGLQESHVAVLPLPTLGAVALYDRHQYLPAEVATGNHVAELFLAATTRLAGRRQNHALAFFIEDKLWLLLAREGRTVFVHAHRIVSDTDAVFYIAAHLQHFGLLRETTTVIVGGHISPLGSLQRQLSIYFEVVDLELALRESGAEPPTGTGAPEEDDRLGLTVELLLAYQRGLRSAGLDT